MKGIVLCCYDTELFYSGVDASFRGASKRGLELGGVHGHDAGGGDGQDFAAANEKIHSGYGRGVFGNGKQSLDKGIALQACITVGERNRFGGLAVCKGVEGGCMGLQAHQLRRLNRDGNKSAESRIE